MPSGAYLLTEGNYIHYGVDFSVSIRDGDIYSGDVAPSDLPTAWTYCTGGVIMNFIPIPGFGDAEQEDFESDEFTGIRDGKMLVTVEIKIATRLEPSGILWLDSMKQWVIQETECITYVIEDVSQEAYEISFGTTVANKQGDWVIITLKLFQGGSGTQLTNKVYEATALINTWGTDWSGHITDPPELM
jgi:hypothetical protein